MIRKRQQGTFLTVLGFGTGNLKDSKMEQIADHGNGNFAYIDSALEAKKVLVTEMGGTLLTIAKDVKLQVEFNPTKVAAYRLIGYENRLLADEDFEDDTKDAGELGAGHSVTALYEVIPVGVDSPVEVRGLDSLRYQRTTERERASDSDELLFVKLRYKEPDQDRSRLMDLPVMDRTGMASEDFQFASAVAAWGMLLRDSEFCSDFTLDQVARLARNSLGEDEDGYRNEFVRLVETAKTLQLSIASIPTGQQGTSCGAGLRPGAACFFRPYLRFPYPGILPPSQLHFLDVETRRLVPLDGRARWWPHQPESLVGKPGGPPHHLGRRPSPMHSPIGGGGLRPPRSTASFGKTSRPAAPRARHLPHPGQRVRSHGRRLTRPCSEGVQRPRFARCPPDLWHPGPRLRSGSVCILWLRLPGGLLLQGPGSLPLL